ncbi:hypothetical protein PMO31116_02770 [Pandoraea morbifera]|uniref:Zinc ribbon domain-containing protein n=1 Tax=Pandoraea morbifera TaxID=2508300 RepID=A0A5E4VSS9_9BURK|nr:hypothetical protein [Pandoraea morbifera]VVE14314.1 hypothetical protein PMO31116_02770 [Pandoraea morbifera]
MTLKFRNPANGDVVEITYLSCVAAFFLGPLYLLAYGFTWHALVWIALAIGPALIWKSALALSLPATCLLYSLLIHPLLVNRLRANGWASASDADVASAGQRGYDAHDASASTRGKTGMVLAPVVRARAPDTPGANSSAEVRPDEKACPYCGEYVRRQAVRCRHCLASLPAASQ